MEPFFTFVTILLPPKPNHAVISRHLEVNFKGGGVRFPNHYRVHLDGGPSVKVYAMEGAVLEVTLYCREAGGKTTRQTCERLKIEAGSKDRGGIIRSFGPMTPESEVEDTILEHFGRGAFQSITKTDTESPEATETLDVPEPNETPETTDAQEVPAAPSEIELPALPEEPTSPVTEPALPTEPEVDVPASPVEPDQEKATDKADVKQAAKPAVIKISNKPTDKNKGKSSK